MQSLKQTFEPAFPKLLWNRPVNRQASGRLLLVGGHRDEFSDIQAIYQLALAAGIGECHVLMPDSLQKLLGGTPGTSFVPASVSGSLGKAAMAEILSRAADYDAMLIGPNLSNNSESAIVCESILTHFKGQLIICQDALRAAKHQVTLATGSPKHLVIANMPELFQLAGQLSIAINIKDNGVVTKLKIVEQIAEAGEANYLLLGRDMIIAAKNKLSHTPAVSSMDFFANSSIAVASVWFTQNPHRHFEALTTAAYILAQAREKLTKPSDEPLTIKEIEKAIQAVLAHDSF